MDNIEQHICQFCNQPSNIIWVHGHGQCSVCKTNIEECCKGEQAEKIMIEEKEAGKSEIRNE
jgi:hypothetical protein